MSKPVAMLRVLTLASLFPDAARPTFGGFVARQTLGLAARPGVEVRVVAPIGIPPGLSRLERYSALAALPDRETWKGLEVYRPRFPIVPLIGGPLAPAAMAHALFPLLRLIHRDFPFDVIDAEFFYPDGPAAARLSHALGVPFSIKARGSDIHLWAHRAGCGGQILKAGRAAGGLLAVSAALKADMVALGLPEERIRVHYTGVELDRFTPSADRRAAKAAFGVTGPLIVSVGALVPRKGHGIAIDAMRLLPDATLLIAGHGPHRATLEAQIAAAGLGARVRLLGSQPHDALPAVFAAADASVLVSESEGLANAWVESLACGTPVVTADVGGAREAIDRPAAGRLVARESSAVAAALAELIANPPDPWATRRAAERFTWAANAEALEEHLEGIASQPK